MYKNQPDNAQKVDMPASISQETVDNGGKFYVEERERRQQTIIGIVVTIIIMAMIAAIGVTAYQAFYQPQIDVERMQIERSEKAKKQLKKLGAKYKPEVVNFKGGILISKLGYNKPVAKAPTVATYFDPLCPGCGNFNREADKTLISMVNAGQINLEIHPMSFLDKFSAGHYSTRVTGAIMYIASYDNNPQHLLQFVNSIFSEEFQPEEGKDQKPVSNEELIKLAKESGISDEIASKALTGNI